MVYNFNHIFSPEAISSLPMDELIPLLDKPKKIQFFSFETKFASVFDEYMEWFLFSRNKKQRETT